MLVELDRLGRDAIAAEELDRACQYAAGLVAIRRQHTAAITSEIARAWTCGTLDAWAEKETRLRAVSAEEVAEVAASVFHAEERAEFVVRGSGGAR
jgi:predicted Zn-dependent peptidase